MEAKSSMWKGAKKSEKLSIATLGLCILTLSTILALRLF
jgi:hypothetical protein